MPLNDEQKEMLTLVDSGLSDLMKVIDQIEKDKIKEQVLKAQVHARQLLSQDSMSDDESLDMGDALKPLFDWGEGLAKWVESMLDGAAHASPKD